ncbi:MAG: NAD-dependent epimerase/dehydratase family protein [candidate division NC10 bacterium]|nr:NAD-dependent epimerase/dehydratase family protein [candidate division NC10 bacterium]
MKVLITGGAGFLGSHLTDALLARGDDVTILDVVGDLKVRQHRGNARFQYVHDSILHPDILESLILKCDLVYHLAAVVGVEHYVGDPYEVLNVNINGTQAVLKLAYKYNRKVVFSSTSEVYGRNPRVPFREDDERVLGSTRIDRWCYATSKAAAEHFCFAYHRLGLPVVVLRYFNVYGPRLDRIDVGRVITIFMGQVLRGEPVTVIGDGRQTRCFTYIDDAIRATVEAGVRDRAVGEIFNVGSDVETSILELAETMIRIAGSRSRVVFVPQESVYGDSYEDVPRRVPSVQRMQEILGVRAETPLEKGLHQTIEWFRAGNGR